MSWGTVTNNDFTLLDTAISGQTSVTMADANVTLTTGNGIADQARAAILKFIGTNTAVRDVIIPAVTKTYIVNNLTTGGYAIQVKTSAGVAILIPNGTSRLIYCDGTDCFSGDTAGFLTNINGGPVNTFRNKIINGDFEFWQRNTTQTSNGYGSDDRWGNQHVGSTKVHSQQAFALGHTFVPGNPSLYSRTVVTSSAGAGNYALKLQWMEGVHILSGKTVTITFSAKADASKNIAVELYQNFGTGGSPSTGVSTPCGLKALTTSWQKFSFTAVLPSISGKTLGSDGNHSTGLIFWFDAGSTNAARASSLGQQSGTFEISRVSVVEGDATKEADPFSPRHTQQERELCQRYYERCANIWIADATNTSGYYQISFWKVTKRAAPSISNVSMGGAANGGMDTRAISTAGVDYFTSGAAATATGPSRGWSDVWAGDAEL
jgi:hypothetical protein